MLGRRAACAGPVCGGRLAGVGSCPWSVLFFGALWGSRAWPPELAWAFMRPASYSLWEAAEGWAGAGSVSWERSATGVVGSGRAGAGRLRWGAPSVVVAPVLGQDRPQMPLAQRSASGSVTSVRAGAHEPFRIGHWRGGFRGGDLPRPRYRRRPGPRRTSSVNCPARSRTRNRKVRGRDQPRIYQEIADLLGGPRPVRVRGHAEDVHVAGADLDHEESSTGRRRVTAQSTWERNRQRASSAACACRNFRHVVSVRRSGRRGDRQRLEDPADRGRAGPGGRA